LISDLDFGILYIFVISALSVHSIIMAGWASNSKYAFLGSLRSAAQVISYELALGSSIVCIIFFSNSLNLSEIIFYQKYLFNLLPLLPVFIIFFITLLAETNRHPFDLPEAESELVSGYNVEYSSAGFALFFLGEYGNMIAMCSLLVLFFLGTFFIFDISYIKFFILKIFSFSKNFLPIVITPGPLEVIFLDEFTQGNFFETVLAEPNEINFNYLNKNSSGSILQR